jgi:hypothetical protein
MKLEFWWFCGVELWSWHKYACYIFFPNYFRFLWISQAFLEYILYFSWFFRACFLFFWICLFFMNFWRFYFVFLIIFRFFLNFMGLSCSIFCFFCFSKKTWVPRGVCKYANSSVIVTPRAIHTNTGISQMSNNSSPLKLWTPPGLGVHQGFTQYTGGRGHRGVCSPICQTKPNWEKVWIYFYVHVDTLHYYKNAL